MPVDLFWRRIIVCVSALAALLPAQAAAQYLRITKDGVNIRQRPTTSSAVIAQAVTGDVFELKGEEGNWYKINMFSGNYRYVHKSLAAGISSVPELPSSEAVRRSAFRELVNAQDRAVREAERRYPRDLSAQIDYERVLYDRYELPIFHKYGIPPARNKDLVAEGVRRNWLPPM